ncbi:MAG: ferrochelatase, partial [Myxococcales bacterium]|nr:ferrochelatase [Myxococcales bacterium]
MKQSKTGILLLQVGSPDRPTAWSVARYLRRFLGDPRLIDLPAPLRWILVNLIIVPFRSFRSAKAYAKIWTDKGSPLVAYTLEVGEGLQKRLGDSFVVQVGMAFGQPGIKEGVRAFQEHQVDRLLAVPLFPQNSSATTASTTAEAMQELIRQWDFPSLRVAAPFYNRPEFLDAWRSLIEDELRSFQPDHVLFSFHSMPLSHLAKSRHCSQNCLAAPRCQHAERQESSCYRGEAERSAELIAEVCGLDRAQWSLSYQSRLGRQAWLEPSTADAFHRLGNQGKRLAVLSPGFTTDCLETLE